MPWTFAELKAALPSDVSDAQAAETLNAQTATDAASDVLSADVRQVLLETGEWAGLVMLAATTPSATVPSALVGAAILARDTLTLTTTMRTSDDAVWLKVQQLLGALGPQGAGIIADTTVTTLTALRSQARPMWQPPITVGDIQTARAQP